MLVRVIGDLAHLDDAGDGKADHGQRDDAAAVAEFNCKLVRSGKTFRAPKVRSRLGLGEAKIGGRVVGAQLDPDRYPVVQL